MHSSQQLHEVSQVVNHRTYPYCGFLLSEPRQYLLTHVLLLAGMVTYYVVTAF